MVNTKQIRDAHAVKFETSKEMTKDFGFEFVCPGAECSEHELDGTGT